MRFFAVFALLCGIAWAVVPGPEKTAAWPSPTGELIAVTYNVESDADTDVAAVADDIRQVGGADLWGLQEVQNAVTLDAFAAAMADAGRDMQALLGSSGGGDRLAIVFDRDRLELVAGPGELSEVGGSRAPFWAGFRDRFNGHEFIFLTNHFQRGKEAVREWQARELRTWIARQPLPVIAVGDYNFDVDTASWRERDRLEGNRAFEIFLADPAPVAWIEHSPRLPTQCNRRYDSVLDFVFLGGPARAWKASAELLFPDDAYCAAEKDGGADHRPIRARIALPAVSG